MLPLVVYAHHSLPEQLSSFSEAFLLDTVGVDVDKDLHLAHFVAAANLHT